MPKKPKLMEEGDRYKCGNCAAAGIYKRVDLGKDENGDPITMYEYPCTDCALAMIANALKK